MAKETEILFLQPATYQSIEPVTYEAGEIRKLRADLAERWVKRGLATTDREAIAAAKAAKEPKPQPVAPTSTSTPTV